MQVLLTWETAQKIIYDSGTKDEEQIKTELLQLVKESGNYIAPGTETDYKDALLLEYQKFVVKTERDAKLEISKHRS